MGRAYQGLNKGSKFSLLCKAVPLKPNDEKKCFGPADKCNKFMLKYYIKQYIPKISCPVLSFSATVT